MCAISALFITVGAVMTLHFYYFGLIILYFGFIFLLYLMYLWWKDVIKESTFLGYHTIKVSSGLKLGMILFIVSEIMFFFSFFWAFFHSSLTPSFILGSVWPPIGINVLFPLHIPLLNTFILLSSGFTVTVCHYGVCLKKNILFKYQFFFYNDFIDFIISWRDSFKFDTIYFKYLDKFLEILNNFEKLWNLSRLFSFNYFEQTFIFLVLTIFLAIEFTLLQGLEYFEALFYINDNVYGSSFYLTTGFHGLHVIIGTIFLIVSLIRLLLGHFTSKHHLGFEFAIWYWHFVDVVWLFLFVMVYLWSTGNFF
jgi:heme/copper-type cytochrome/quinol oxidase subunit 3